tara:strand:- start:415 stop:906 length:492 start_codon:yes stop_codon:yes gene_type:complete
MNFIFKKHDTVFYNTLLDLSRNIFFYTKIKLLDNFETRLYLIFIHFSIMLIVHKNKESKFDQNLYDSLFHNIENNLRESGFGDVAVNKKMKEFNKILYDILLKINKNDKNDFEVNFELISKYFPDLNDKKSDKYVEFENYFSKFYKFCFGLPLNNMLENVKNF